MGFWELWFIGIGISIVTRIAIDGLTVETFWKDNYYIEVRSKSTQAIMNVLVIICIILVGGIANGMWLGSCESEENVLAYILAAIIPACFTYVVGYSLLGLKHFSNPVSHLIFVVVFIISIIGWTITICDYNRNIETITETTITTEERKLLYFCNIPVQEISGQNSGSSFLGTGSISGKISTSNELSYWYANENNEGKYGSVNASISKIVFISNEEKPYLEIVSYSTYTKKLNHNNGKEDIKINKEWKEYIFYLPEAIMQYSLD